MNQKELLATAIENVATVEEVNNNYPFNLAFKVTKEFWETYNGRNLRMELYYNAPLITLVSIAMAVSQSAPQC